jgi:hypothetical protein
VWVGAVCGCGCGYSVELCGTGETCMQLAIMQLAKCVRMDETRWCGCESPTDTSSPEGKQQCLYL